MEKTIPGPPFRIAVLGPECSGKTTLCAYLEEAHGAEVVHEYAREFLDSREGEYGLEELMHMARVQYDLNAAIRSGPTVCDTEMITMLIWSQDKFNMVPDALLKLVDRQGFDSYLLCAPDFPWVYDPLREDPTNRDRLFETFKVELEKRSIPFKVIKGERLHRERTIDSLFSFPR